MRLSVSAPTDSCPKATCIRGAGGPISSTLDMRRMRHLFHWFSLQWSSRALPLKVRGSRSPSCDLTEGLSLLLPMMPAVGTSLARGR